MSDNTQKHDKLFAEAWAAVTLSLPAYARDAFVINQYTNGLCAMSSDCLRMVIKNPPGIFKHKRHGTLHEVISYTENEDGSCTEGVFTTALFPNRFEWHEMERVGELHDYET